MKIKELFSSKDKWTQKGCARDEIGDLVPSDSPKAHCFCLMGAINRCYPSYDSKRELIIEKIHNAIPCPYSITRWNDDPDRTFEEVKELVTKLDI